MCTFLLNRLSQIAVLMNEKTCKLLPTCTFFYVTRMRSGRMRTACLLAVFCSAQRVGVCPTPLDVDPPGCRPPGSKPPGCRSTLDADPPWMQTGGCGPLDACRTPQCIHPGCRPPSACRPPSLCSPLDADLFLDADPLVMWPVTHAGKPLPPVDRMIDACKNITLFQTSFAGGNNDEYCLTCKMATVMLDLLAFHGEFSRIQQEIHS